MVCVQQCKQCEHASGRSRLCHCFTATCNVKYCFVSKWNCTCIFIMGIIGSILFLDFILVSMAGRQAARHWRRCAHAGVLRSRAGRYAGAAAAVSMAFYGCCLAALLPFATFFGVCLVILLPSVLRCYALGRCEVFDSALRCFVIAISKDSCSVMDCLRTLACVCRCYDVVCGVCALSHNLCLVS